MPTERMGPPPGASPPMRMTASWSGLTDPTAYKSVARKCAPNGELPSGSHRHRYPRDPEAMQSPIAVHHRSACSGVKALRNTSDARRQAAKLCYRFGPLTPSARSANLIAGDGTWRNRRASAAHQTSRKLCSVNATPEENMEQQSHYVGLDVSLKTTSICVIDDAGAIIWRGKCSSDPDTITAIVRQHAPAAMRVGLETGQLSNWLTLSLRRRGVPVICMDARHAKAALSLQINKTDANDAFGLAQVVRTGWYREVAVKSMDAHTLRMLLVARSRLASQHPATANKH